MAITFGMLLNLAAVANSEDPQVLWGFLRRYAPDVSAATHPRLDRMVAYAARSFLDFVRPAKKFRAPDSFEREALENLADALAALNLLAFAIHPVCDCLEVLWIKARQANALEIASSNTSGQLPPISSSPAENPS